MQKYKIDPAKISYYFYPWFPRPVRKGYVLEPEDWKYTTARSWSNGADDVISIDVEYL